MFLKLLSQVIIVTVLPFSHYECKGISWKRSFDSRSSKSSCAAGRGVVFSMGKLCSPVLCEGSPLRTFTLSLCHVVLTLRE